MTVQDKGALNKLIAGRIALLLDHYFFGHLAMRLKFVEQVEIPTLAVDGRNIFYNPDFIRTLNADLIKSAICHEIMHCVQQHMIRRNGRDPQLWNVAGDYVINLILEDAGFRIGDGWLVDEKYRDMSTEHIYELLRQQKDGGASPGQALDNVMDGAQSESEAIEQQMNWEIAVSQAAQLAREHGKLPKGLERFIKEIEAPTVPWREVLQRFITEISRSDYSWLRPSRKMIAHGYYLPSLYSTDMGTLVPVIDTSGSIDQPTLSAFASEIIAAWHAAHPQKMINIYCDARIAHIDEVEQGAELPEFKPHGGGGTDFRPPFAWLEENDIKPAALIYLTDGYGPFPEEAPNYPVLWCMTSDVTPPWGEVVRVKI